MLKAYKYRIYPSIEQINKIEHHFGCCRLIWNLALDAKKSAYEANKTNIGRYDLQKQLIDLKLEYEWLYEVNSQSLLCVILNLDTAYKSFFKGSGFPNFKKKTGSQSFSCPQNVYLDGDKIRLPKIGLVNISLSRVFNGVIKTTTISKTPSGKYYASILVDNKKEYPIKQPISSCTTIGIDVGLKDFAVLSSGEKFTNHKYYNQSLARLKCLQRRLSKKQIGGVNRKKAAKKVALQYESITNQRNDFLHKLSTSIVKRYDSICVEDLAVSNMLKNRKLSKAISDVGWGEFFKQLEYKSNWYGKNYFEVGRFFASSKTCSSCGSINTSLMLSDREWVCANCEETHDRDINAAKNIKQYMLTNSGKGLPGEPVESPSIDGAMKQEFLIKTKIYH